MFSDQLNFIYAVILAFFVSFIAYKKEALTKDGAVAAFILGAIIFGFGGIKWSVPLLAFFIPSSILSHFRKNKKNKVDEFFEKSGRRDFGQVLANGAAGGILVIVNYFFPSVLWFWFYAVYFAVMSSDTWATELGTLKERKTYNILTFRRVEQGVSGGISLFGLFAALAGSAVIGLSALPWLNNLSVIFPVIIVAGFIGSLIDSSIGASIQVQYQCNVCGKLTERKIHCDTQTGKVRGLEWFNNDWVNFVSGLTGVATFYLIFSAIA